MAGTNRRNSAEETQSHRWQFGAYFASTVGPPMRFADGPFAFAGVSPDSSPVKCQS